MKIEGQTAEQQARMYGRHFEARDQLVSKISRESINALKSHFADEMTKDDWRLVGRWGRGGAGVWAGGGLGVGGWAVCVCSCTRRPGWRGRRWRLPRPA